ncbi:MAG: alpha/beta fold hydrolase [Puniceicoccales bacterium]|jgi:haloalkane dehalogenase|nr:alpha/beta fold hydrolase [Puniceicoccales bacterium]
MRAKLPGVVREIFPYKSRFIRLTSGARLHYIDEGENNLTLFLHDIPFWSFYFRRLVDNLRNHFRCLAPDYIGFGLSDKPPNADYSLHSMTNDAIELLTQLKVGKFNLVLHGWGAVPGMVIATRWPERTNRIVILNGSCFPENGGPFAPNPFLGGFFGTWLVNCMNTPIRRAALSTGCDAPSYAGYLFPYRSWSSRMPTRIFFENLPNYGEGGSEEQWLRAIAEKIFILSHKKIAMFWGTRDKVFSEDVLEKWKKEFEEMKVTEFHGGGHHTLEEEFDTVSGPIRHLLAGGIEAKIPTL